MLEELMNFFELNSVVSWNKHGFEDGHSSATIMILFLDEILKTTYVFGDVSRAFDCIQLDELLDNLYKFGNRGNVFS